MTSRKRPFKLTVAWFLVSTSALAFEYGDPTAIEQAHLERLNRARADPIQEAQRLKIELLEGVPANALTATAAQPLSSNAILLSVARSHSADMLKQNYFAHNSLAGLSPFERMAAANYTIQAAGENIAWQGAGGKLDQTATALSLHDALFTDKNSPGRGHRINILDPEFREVGVGLAFGAYTQNRKTYNAGIVTTDFGTRSGSKPIILGVVYDDKNADQLYTAGEGLADIEVAVSAVNATKTAAAGGYGLEVDPDTDYTLTFTHSVDGAISKTVHVDHSNIKVDILRDAFSNSLNINPQCASFVQNQLSIPCVTVSGSVLSAELVVIKGTPLQFALHSVINSAQSVTAQCGTYNKQTNTVRLNCVALGKDRFWSDLQLKETDAGLTFELGNFGVVQ